MFRVYKQGSIASVSTPIPILLLYIQRFLHSLSTILTWMSRSRRPSKGKRKASPAPSISLSSDEGDSRDTIADAGESHPIKRPRLNSPARVRQAALAKVASTSKSGSSSKGLAGFAALINTASLSAARKETNQGLRRSGASSLKRSRGAAPQSKAGRVVLLQFCFVLCTKN